MAQLIRKSRPADDAPWYSLNEDLILLILQKLSRSSYYWDSKAKPRALAADFVSISRVNHQLKALEDETCWPLCLVLVCPHSVDYLHWLAKRAHCVRRLEFRGVREDSFQSEEQIRAFAKLLTSCAGSLVCLTLDSCHQVFASTIMRMVGILCEHLTILECTNSGVWEDYEGVRAVADGCPKLRHIELSETTWAETETTPIPEDIVIALAKGCPQLESVVLSRGILELSGLLSLLDKCENLKKLRFVPLDSDFEPFLSGASGTRVVNQTVQYLSIHHQIMSLEKDLMPLLRLCPNVAVVRSEMDPCDLGDEDFPIESNTNAYFDLIR